MVWVEVQFECVRDLHRVVDGRIHTLLRRMIYTTDTHLAVLSSSTTNPANRPAQVVCYTLNHTTPSAHTAAVRVTTCTTCYILYKLLRPVSLILAASLYMLTLESGHLIGMTLTTCEPHITRIPGVVDGVARIVIMNNGWKYSDS